MVNWNLSNSRSLRASDHTGVAISRIEAPFLDNIQVDSGKQHKKNGMYDDGLSGIRWRFPHQFANWFGMTVLFGGRTSLYKFQFVDMITCIENCKVVKPPVRLTHFQRKTGWQRCLCQPGIIQRTYSMMTQRLGSTPVEWVVMLSISCRAAWITWRS